MLLCEKFVSRGIKEVHQYLLKISKRPKKLSHLKLFNLGKLSCQMNCDNSYWGLELREHGFPEMEENWEHLDFQPTLMFQMPPQNNLKGDINAKNTKRTKTANFFWFVLCCQKLQGVAKKWTENLNIAIFKGNQKLWLYFPHWTQKYLSLVTGS